MAHRAEDWQFVAGIGEGFVAERDSRVVGTVLCWKYGERTSSLGMVIVSPAHQGFGIGRKLTEMALGALGLTRVDSVVKMVRNAEQMPSPGDEFAQYGIINQAIG